MRKTDAIVRAIATAQNEAHKNGRHYVVLPSNNPTGTCPILEYSACSTEEFVNRVCVVYPDRTVEPK